MALPTVTKTWQFQSTWDNGSGSALRDCVNLVYGALGSCIADNKHNLLMTKRIMTGFASHPWTVSGSSDGSTTNMAGSDLWVDTTKVVWTPVATNTAHSWIVLRQNGISAKYEICIDCIGTNEGPYGRYFAIAYSPSAGFGVANGGTDGSTTARPTATDEVQVKPGSVGNDDSAMFYALNTDYSGVLHIMQSTDGQAFRLFFCYANNVTAYWEFGLAQQPVAGWTTPGIAVAIGTGISQTLPTYANLSAAVSVNSKGRAPGGPMSLVYGGEGWIGQHAGQRLTVPNDISASYTLCPVSIASETAACRGRHGRIFDLWWGSTAHSNGTAYPADATRTFAQFGNLVTPWNGTAILTA